MRDQSKAVNFAKALTEGFRASEDAAIAKKEIDDVFQKLHDEVLKASDGKISIDRVKKEGRNIGVAMLDHILRGPEEWVIVAFSGYANGKRVNEVDLAGWKPDYRGYPCEVTYNHLQNTCGDREGLERTLADLLSDASTGRKMKKLMEKNLGEKS